MVSGDDSTPPPCSPPAYRRSYDTCLYRFAAINSAAMYTNVTPSVAVNVAVTAKITVDATVAIHRRG